LKYQYVCMSDGVWSNPQPLPGSALVTARAVALSGRSRRLPGAATGSGAEKERLNRLSIDVISALRVCRCVDPYLAVSPLCTCPLLPEVQRPRPKCKELGTPKYPRTAASTGRPVSRLQSFTHVQAPTLARPPGCSHRRRSRSPGRPGRLHRALPGWLPAPGSGIAPCPTRATGMAGLAPAGVQPCRLLPHLLDDTQSFMEV
jgi:hypothetical protein